MSIMYASHMSNGCPDTFQAALNILLKVIKLPSSPIGDSPALGPIGITSDSPSNRNNIHTSNSVDSPAHPAPHFSTHTLTPGNLPQMRSNSSPNLVSHVSDEAAKEMQLEQNVSGTENETFHSINKEPSPVHPSHAQAQHNKNNQHQIVQGERRREKQIHRTVPFTLIKNDEFNVLPSDTMSSLQKNNKISIEHYCGYPK